MIHDPSLFGVGLSRVGFTTQACVVRGCLGLRPKTQAFAVLGYSELGFMTSAFAVLGCPGLGTVTKEFVEWAVQG